MYCSWAGYILKGGNQNVIVMKLQQLSSLHSYTSFTSSFRIQLDSMSIRIHIYIQQITTHVYQYQYRIKYLHKYRSKLHHYMQHINEAWTMTYYGQSMRSYEVLNDKHNHKFIRRSKDLFTNNIIPHLNNSFLF